MTVGTPTARRQVGGLLVAALALVLVSAVVTPAVALERVTALVDDPAAFGAAVLALYLVRPVFFWPMTPVAVVVGYGYGLRVGLPVALAGAVGTCLVPFFAARYVRTDVGPLGRLVASGEALFETTGGVRGVLAARLAPIPTDVVSYAAGLSGVSLRALVVGTAVGEFPWTVLAVLAGASMETLSADGLRAVEWGWPVALLAGACAAVVLAGPRLCSRFNA